MSGKTATFIKDVKMRGDAALYLLSEPIEGVDMESYVTSWDWVVVSAVDDSMLGRSETLIFPSDSEGEIEDWQELEGSYRDGMDHNVALEGAGYKVIGR